MLNNEIKLITEDNISISNNSLSEEKHEKEILEYFRGKSNKFIQRLI